MNSLPVIVYFLGLVVLCQSACFFQMLKLTDINNPPKSCVDKDSKEHAFGSEWTTKDCLACSCSEHGMSCCAKMPSRSAMEIPADCELLENKATCSFKIVMKSDHSKECNPL